MKNTFYVMFVLLVVVGFFNQTGCKTSEQETSQYSLTVTLASGVSGTPVTGSYSYDEIQNVSYSYTLQSGYENLVVTLDDVAIADSGLISMNRDHVLRVNAESEEPDEQFHPSLRCDES